MTTIELPENQNTPEAIVDTDGQRNSALMTANVGTESLILSDKTNVSTAIYVDDNGKRHKVQLVAVIYGGGESANTEITLTGESGTLTAAQIELVKKNDPVIVCDGQVFRLANKSADLSYRTFVCTDCALETGFVHYAIYVQLNEQAANYGVWSKEQEE